MIIDIAENRRKMAEAVDSGFYGGVQEMMKTQTNFAMGGAALGFIFSVTARKGWIPWTIGGLIVGAIGGWVVTGIKQDILS